MYIRSVQLQLKFATPAKKKKVFFKMKMIKSIWATVSDL